MSGGKATTPPSLPRAKAAGTPYTGKKKDVKEVAAFAQISSIRAPQERPAEGDQVNMIDQPRCLAVHIRNVSPREFHAIRTVWDDVSLLASRKFENAPDKFQYTTNNLHNWPAKHSAPDVTRGWNTRLVLNAESGQNDWLIVRQALVAACSRLDAVLPHVLPVIKEESRDLCKQDVRVFQVDGCQYMPIGGSMLSVVMDNRFKLQTLTAARFPELRPARVYLVDDEGEFLVEPGQWHYTITSTGQLDPFMFNQFYSSFGWNVEVAGCAWQNRS